MLRPVRAPVFHRAAAATPVPLPILLSAAASFKKGSSSVSVVRRVTDAITDVVDYLRPVRIPFPTLENTPARRLPGIAQYPDLDHRNIKVSSADGEAARCCGPAAGGSPAPAAATAGAGHPHLTRADLLDAQFAARQYAASRNTEFARDYWDGVATKFRTAALK